MSDYAGQADGRHASHREAADQFNRTDDLDRWEAIEVKSKAAR